MAVQKTTAQTGGTAYSVVDAHGNVTMVRASPTKGAIILGPVTGASGHFTQGNINDLLPVLQNFAATGILT